MDKLKLLIEEYGEWKFLSEYLDRIESYLDIDFSQSFDNAKALLESVGKEVCERNRVVLRPNSTMNGVLKQCFSSMGFTNADMVKRISSALATIAQEVGNLRNEIGSTSHGKSQEEMNRRNDRVDKLTQVFLVDTVETLCVFIIRTFESRAGMNAGEFLEPEFGDKEVQAFNEFWDESYGEFAMGDYSYTASEILFSVDREAYTYEYQAFTGTAE